MDARGRLTWLVVATGIALALFAWTAVRGSRPPQPEVVPVTPGVKARNTDAPEPGPLPEPERWSYP